MVARGIVAGREPILVADVQQCTSEPTLPGAQLFVSSDGGKTWQKRGPAIEGAAIVYAQERHDGWWLAGLRMVEGPGTDPFVLVPDAAPPWWTLHTVHEGPADLRRVARDGDGGVLMWIRHIVVGDERWRGALHLHRSRDGGRTWTDDGPRKESPAPPGARDFARIARRTASWRIADRADGGFDVQHRGSGGWQTTATFPWRACDPSP
jgi:hypothetical protein